MSLQIATIDQTIAPTESRLASNAAMAARGMRSFAELAAGKPCGTRVRYYAGCRCSECRRAIAEYGRARRAARARGEPNGLVSAEPARRHLARLSMAGVGRKTAADAAKVSSSTVSLVVDGIRTKIRAQTERRILTVTPAAAADRAHIDSRATWKLLDELLECGYSKARIASEILGHPVEALQIHRGRRVTARTAERVRLAHARLVYANHRATARALRMLDDLRAEHYRKDRVLRKMSELAERMNWPAPSLEPATRGPAAGRLRQQEVELLSAVHRDLLADTEEA